METNTLTILGFSEATITMIMDVLYENNSFPLLKVVNNLNLPPQKGYRNKRFKLEILTELPEYQDVIIGAARMSSRKAIRETFSDVPIESFTKLIANSSAISSSADIGNGVIINPMCSIAGQTSISNFVFINRGVLIGHHTYIGEFTTINPGANIAGNVHIGNNCQIGMSAKILDGVSIGENTIIGAGSVVTKDVPANIVAYGSPCKIIRENG
jgi:sugar O-acyltransferase (sialic acid O-acetyltransferase NeuD family)